MTTPPIPSKKRFRPAVALLIAALAVVASLVSISRDSVAQEDAGAADDDAAAEAPAADGGAAAGAAEAEEDEEDTGPPVDVTVGVYVNQIRDVNLRENNFEVDFWIWFRWAKNARREINPLESFEVVGGDIESKVSEVREDLGEWNYAACRVVAKVTRFFDIQRFPQDSHEIAIVIEDSANEDHKVRFVADRDNSRLDPGVQAPGFVIASSESALTTHSYTTNYGDITLPSNSQSRYSRFEYRVRLKRPGFGYAVKLLWALWLSGLVAFVAFFVKPTEVDPRFGLGVGALFAAMASQFVVVGSLPESSLVTTADWVGMIAILFIFLSIVQSAFSLWLCQQDREPTSQRLDRASFAVFMTLYVVLNVIAMW